jgi:UDP-N-acetylmuramate dehydrogenase
VDNKLFDSFSRILGEENVLLNEPMSRHTTFRIGGPADYFLMPKTEEQVKEVLEICTENQLPFFLLGNGSNLLVSDSGYRGVVIQLYRNFSAVEIEGTTLYVKAGCLLSTASRAAMEAGLTGMEFAGGIPGTLGGGVVMNAGAYGGEMKDVLESVKVLTQEGKFLTLQADRLAMGYRTSLIKKKGYIVLEAALKLAPGDREEIRQRMRELTKLRTGKQPLEFPSAGSTFKRPEGYFAGKLIMDAGLRGYRVGGAMVSEKHCGFVINVENATAEDVKQLIGDVQETVREKFGVTLEPEIKFLGDF